MERGNRSDPGAIQDTEPDLIGQPDILAGTGIVSGGILCLEAGEAIVNIKKFLLGETFFVVLYINDWSGGSILII